MITQNIDRIVTKNDFKGPDLAVTTIFRTLQGEGPYAGWPAVFIRFAGCNFGNKTDYCKFCDTSFQLDQAKWFSVDGLVEEVKTVYKPGDIIVITGGEPTLQPLLPSFMLALSAGLSGPAPLSVIQLESNGTQAYFFVQAPELRHDLARLGTVLSLVVSPKANEKAGRYGQLSRTVLDNIDFLKFVLSADPASAHHTVPEWAPVSKTYVSPMAEYKKAYQGEVSSIWDHDLIDAPATQRNYAYAAQVAINNGMKLSVQTHLFTAIP